MMIYINGFVVTGSNEYEVVLKEVKDFISTRRLLIVDSNNDPMSQEQLSTLLLHNSGEIQLTAIETSIVLRAFKEELDAYTLKVEQYVDNTRASEDFSSVLNSYAQVTEALIKFISVEEFLQKQLLDKQLLNELTHKCLKRAEEGNFEYILDIMEYELLPLLRNFVKETNEVM